MVNKLIYKNYIDLINNFYKNYGDGLKIILHSDSNVLKNKLKELNNEIITLDIKIKHIAKNIGINNMESFISTVAEFYIILKANKIYMPNIYTGISHIASIIKTKLLYTHINIIYFNYLHSNNITILNTSQY